MPAVQVVGTHTPCQIVLEAGTVHANSIVGIDCMSKFHRVRLGLDSIYIQDLKVGTTIRCTLRNPNASELHIGTVLVRCVQLQLQPAAKLQSIGACIQRKRGIESAFESYIKDSFSVFQDGTLVASDSRVARIHAPMFKGRACTMPGICFWMTPWEGFSEQYLNHLGGIIACRLGFMPNAQTPRNKQAYFLAELCIAYPSSCEYVSDYYTKGKKMFPFESFDDLFVRQCGDCEDFSKAACSIFDHIRFSEWEGEFARTLQSISQHYVACSVLGLVSKASYSGAAAGGWAAHMFVKLIPQKTIAAWADLPKKWGITEGVALGATPCMPPLRVFCCEGTGHVRCDLATNGAEGTDVQLADIKGLTQTSLPGVSNSFYKKDVHLFTNTLFRLGIPQGHFTFMSGRRYGVPFEDVYEQRASVSLYSHPPITTQLQEYISGILTHERPSPQLIYSGPTISQPSCDEPATGVRQVDYYLADGGNFKSLARLARKLSGSYEVITEAFTDNHVTQRARLVYKNNGE